MAARCMVDKATRAQAHARVHAPTHPHTHTNTHTHKYGILFAFLLQKWFRERASVFHCTYIAWLVHLLRHVPFCTSACLMRVFQRNERSQTVTTATTESDALWHTKQSNLAERAATTFGIFQTDASGTSETSSHFYSTSRCNNWEQCSLRYNEPTGRFHYTNFKQNITTNKNKHMQRLHKSDASYTWCKKAHRTGVSKYKHVCPLIQYLNHRTAQSKTINHLWYCDVPPTCFGLNWPHSKR
jgi:hypothetical protein